MVFLKKTVFLLLAVFLIYNVIIYADIPLQIEYQGSISEQNGAPLPDGLNIITFTNRATETNGNAVWTSNYRTANLTDSYPSYKSKKGSENVQIKQSKF